MYIHIKNKYILIKEDITFFEKIYASLFSGFIGSLMGNPCDLILVRM